jgi:hypothetical protein
MHDGGQSADQLPESLDCPGFATDVDADVRSGKYEGGQGLGGSGDRDVGRSRRCLGGDRPLVAVAFDQVVRPIEPKVPAGWLVVVGGEVDGLDGGAEQVLRVQRLAGVGPTPGVPQPPPAR